MIFKLAWKNISSRPLSTGLSIVLLSSSIMVIVLGTLTINQMKLKFNKMVKAMETLGVHIDG